MLRFTERKDTASTCEDNEEPRLQQNLFPNPIRRGGSDWPGLGGLCMAPPVTAAVQGVQDTGPLGVLL